MASKKSNNNSLNEPYIRFQAMDSDKEISKKLRLNDTIGEYQRFEDLLFNLSAKFINLPADQIDTEIDNALTLMGQFLEIDRISLAQFTVDRSKLVATHYYTAPGISKPPVSIVDDHMPWITEKILAEETVVLKNISKDFPEEASIDKQYAVQHGIKSALILPLKISGNILGVLFFTSLSIAIYWPNHLVQKLQIASDIICKALWRKEAALRIEKHLMFEQLLSDISAEYINIPGDEVEERIDASLERIATFLEADICSILLKADKKNAYQVIRSWVSGKVKHPVHFIATPENTPWMYEKWSAGEACQFTHTDELPKAASVDKLSVVDAGIKSHISIPFSQDGEVISVIGITSINEHRQWPKELERQLRLIGGVFANALARKKTEQKLNQAFFEIKNLKEQLEVDYTYLREEIKLEHNFDEIIGQSDVLKYVLFKVAQVAPTDTIVLILGETGTGKELIARAIHNASLRKDRPLVKVNCAVLPANLIESELFGHEKGAFTGADKRKAGRFEIANGATLFLDEIGELPLELQAKLLRVLQDGEFERLGSNRTIKLDARIIAATNRDLEKEVKAGLFRQDLWYRLNVFPITVHPLRDRKEDIPLLVKWFIKKFEKKFGKVIENIPSKTMNAMKQYAWPGNVRELENVIERAVINTEGSVLKLIDEFNPTMVKEKETSTKKKLKEMLLETERDHIVGVLEATGWKIEGKNGAAAALDVAPSTLRSRMQKIGIRRKKCQE